jgi:hypothetical protein
MTPRQTVEAFQRGRSEMAKRILQFRKALRTSGRTVDIHRENDLVRRLCYNPVGYGAVKPPVKPTVENLACLAEIYTLYGRAPLPWERDPNWVNPKSTEYYSACGYEDHLFYQREEAREYAEELIEAVDYLLLLERFPVADMPRDLTIL